MRLISKGEADLAAGIAHLVEHFSGKTSPTRTVQVVVSDGMGVPSIVVRGTAALGVVIRFPEYE